MTEELERSYATLERRISERTRDLEAARDLLDAFFRISTSRLDPDNIDKTLDSVLRFCSRLGYDLAMISFVDRPAGVIRAARATGSMAGLVDLTVRSIDGEDILAVVVREGRAIVIPDSTARPAVRSGRGRLVGHSGPDRRAAGERSGAGDSQVASRLPLDPEPRRSAPARDPGQPHGAGLDGPAAARGDPPAQSDSGTACRRSWPGPSLHCASRPGSCSRCSTAWATVSSSPTRMRGSWSSTRRRTRILGHGRTETPAQDWSRHYEIFLPDRMTPYPGRGSAA